MRTDDSLALMLHALRNSSEWRLEYDTFFLMKYKVIFVFRFWPKLFDVMEPYKKRQAGFINAIGRQTLLCQM